jgi:hypothetical protein
MSIGAPRSLRPVNGTIDSPDTTFERHFNIDELAAIWKYSRETVRQLVKDEPGVIKVRNGPRKTMTRYSIPESVARRIHTRLLNPGAL